MGLNEVLAVSARRAASLLLIGFAVPALAGDRAAFNAIGFSADARYFAFEEYGIQDGSGFPYANIYAIDLQADKWVAGAPFSVRLDADGASLTQARQDVAMTAAAAVDHLSLTWPAEILALNGDGEPGDSQTLSFGQPGYGIAEPQNVQTLSLETFPATWPGSDCASYTDRPTEGVAVLLDGVEFYRDTALPKSRGCALDYGLHAVVAPFQQRGAVLILSVYTHGFEGPDRRFIAIPLSP